MAIKLNNSADITACYFNASEATEVRFNGTSVFTKQVQQTATPTIPSFSYIFNAWYINIKNNDTSSADVYAEANDSTPDVYRGLFAGGDTVQITDNSQPSFATFTYYVTAQASGKTISTVYSRTIT